MNMKQVRFGRTDLMVSRLCFGCVSFGVRDPSRDWDPFTREGKAKSLALMAHAFERGVTLFDTSPDYGDGHSETLLGEAFAQKRDQVIIASKVDYGGQTAQNVKDSVENSLKRLGTDYIDIIQFHGGNYPPASYKRIMEKGLLDALLDLKSEGKVRHIGLTVADPITAKSLIETDAFDMVQMLYNLVEQAAARHALKWASERDLGVTVMRPLAAGMLEVLFAAIAPQWANQQDIIAACLKFLLSDPRLHTINIGIRNEDELAQNIDLVNNYEPELNVADLPRSVGQAARGTHKVAPNTDPSQQDALQIAAA